MPTMNEDTGQVTFDPQEDVVARIVHVGTKPFNERGATSLWGRLMLLDGAGRELELRFSCAPWRGYLHDSIHQCHAEPGQRFSGFHVMTNDRGYHEIVGIDGVGEPADWEAQKEDMGIGRPRVQANNRPALRAPRPRPTGEGGM